MEGMLEFKHEDLAKCETADDFLNLVFDEAKVNIRKLHADALASQKGDEHKYKSASGMLIAFEGGKFTAREHAEIALYLQAVVFMTWKGCDFESALTYVFGQGTNLIMRELKEVVSITFGIAKQILKEELSRQASEASKH